MQEVTGNNVELAYVDQGYTGENAAQAVGEARRAVGGCQTHGRPNVASFCCPAAGWRSEALHGRPASAGWHGTTNDSPKPSKDFTTWPSPSSCSPIWQDYSRKVHTTLVEPGELTQPTSANLQRSQTLWNHTRSSEQFLTRLAGMERGDPEATSEAVLKLVDADDPPLRLGLGNSILPRARAAYAERLVEWEAWEEVSNAAMGEPRNRRQSGSSSWLTELRIRHDAADESVFAACETKCRLVNGANGRITS